MGNHCSSYRSSGNLRSRPALARVCQTHANWSDADCGVEELSSALADTSGRAGAATSWSGASSTRWLNARAKIAEVPTLQSRMSFDVIADGGPEPLERTVTRV